MIAAVKLPNINPMIKIDMVFLTLLAAKMTADKTKKEPKLEAIAIDQLEDSKNRKLPKKEEPKMSNATPKLAPEEIPNTNGPANGFLNKVCINKPLIDNPEPTNIAVIAFGNLKFKMIVCQLSLTVSSPKKMAKISLKGIETEPKLMFTKHKNTTRISNKINCFVYVLFFIKREMSGRVESRPNQD